MHWYFQLGWLGSRVVSVLDSGAEGPGLGLGLTVLGKLFTPIVPLFTKQRKLVETSLTSSETTNAALPAALPALSC